MKMQLAVIVTGALLGACATSPEAGQQGGRNWSKVDANKDGSVSPDEMEKWLKANPGPDAKKQQ